MCHLIKSSSQKTICIDFIIIQVSLSITVIPFNSTPFTKRTARIAQNRNTKRLIIIIEFNMKKYS